MKASKHRLLALAVMALTISVFVAACAYESSRSAPDAVAFGTSRQEAGNHGTANNDGFFFGDLPPSGNRRVEQSARIEGVYRGEPSADPDNRASSGEPYDMFFKEHGVNPFVDTEDDKLSTFALECDTGSYTVSRNYLNRGHLPPSEAVRTEEFVNYLKYRYEAPKNSVFNIAMDAAPSRYGADLKNCHILRVGLKAKEVDAAARKRAVLTFVIDISGSMQMENRLGYVKQALNMLVKQLRSDDYVGIAVYGSTGQRWLGHTNNPGTIIEAIDRLQSSGSTNAEEGIRIGYEMAAESFRAGSINRVILCSDGVANVGNTGPEAILKTIEANRRKGITLSAIGFGMSNYNDTLMEQLGDKGDGHYAYVDTLDEAKKTFVDNLTGTLQVVARDVKMQVEFNPQVVKSYRLLGYENRDVADKDFRNNAVDGGEIGAGHSVTAIYEVKLYENVPGEMATTTVRWKHDEQDEYSETSKAVHTSQIKAWQESPANLRLAANVAEFAELMRKSYWAKGGAFEPVIEDLKKLISETDDTEVLELVSLVVKARDLRKAGTATAGGE